MNSDLLEDKINLMRQFAQRESPAIYNKNYEEKFIVEHTNKRKFNQILDTILEHKDKSTSYRLLDVGCGIGSLLYYAHKKKFDIFGIDFDFFALKAAKEIYGFDNRAILFQARSEHLPFRDNSFDYITSLAVIEHCDNIKEFISEIIRVLKPGGIFYLVTPNHGTFWEPHYDILWFPLLPKKIAKIYLLMRTRDPSYLSQIHYVTLDKILKALKYNDNLEIYNLSQDLFDERIESIDKIGSPRIRRLMELIKKLRLHYIIKLLGKLGFYYPIVVLVKKKDNCN